MHIYAEKSFNNNAKGFDIYKFPDKLKKDLTYNTYNKK